jgi:hypothetical protein
MDKDIIINILYARIHELKTHDSPANRIRVDEINKIIKMLS